MLKTNWSLGTCRETGRAYVIRQRLGVERARKSNAVHKFMSDTARTTLAARLERDAARV